MPFLIQSLLQFVLPVVLLLDMFKRDYRRRRDWLIDASLVLVILLIVFQIARWDWTSYYLRILLLPAFGLVAYAAYRCIDKNEQAEQSGALAPNLAEENPTLVDLPAKVTIGNIVKSVIAVALAGLNIVLLLGSLAPADAVELYYPVRGSVYYVGGGGASRWINNHHAFPPQDYALDIVQLNGFGNRAMGIAPESLDSYEIFGSPVFSPCGGQILIAEDGHIDNVPPARDSVNLAGNHIVIACEGVEILLAHLQHESIAVEQGDVVEAGTMLGNVGNSGHSSQPHLHIHAERGGEPGKILEGEGVPITFNGRFLVRNSLFSGRVQVED